MGIDKARHESLALQIHQRSCLVFVGDGSVAHCEDATVIYHHSIGYGENLIYGDNLAVAQNQIDRGSWLSSDWACCCSGWQLTSARTAIVITVLIIAFLIT